MAHETADRHKQWQQRHQVRSVRLTGEAHKALAEYKRRHGYRSLSEAVMALTDHE